MAEASKAHRTSKAMNIQDLRGMAQRRLPKVVFDYVDGGAEDEITLRANEQVFGELTFRPRHAVSFPHCNLRTKVLNFDLAIPFLLAPVGYSRLMHPAGEIGAARAAGAAGTAYILSTVSGHAMEKVKEATPGPAWYQLYLLGGRTVGEAALERARAAGYSALVVTIDTAVAGMRERDFRNGMREILGGGAFAQIPYLGQFLTHPRWLSHFLMDGGMPRLPNVVLPGTGPMPLTDVATALASSVVTWRDFPWIREAWNGPILVKGVLTGDDARCAIDHGASAVVVSNHGGRQLDCVSSSLRALPEIVKAVNGQAEVLLDGGVRRGSDIVKALCLGARAVLIGRAYAYGLGAAGEAGVIRAIEILKADVERSLRLLGCPSVGELDRSFLEYRQIGNWLDGSLAG
jgi:isopentenyl diphosphate isomerase/L-lactate dehydrogenase-like FMN-dependent dehydrogenase